METTIDKTKELLKKAFYRGNEVADIPTGDFKELAEDWEKWYSDNVKNILPLPIMASCRNCSHK